MARVKIKHKSPSTTTKTKLLETLSKNLIYVTRVIVLSDGFVVLTRTDEDLDAIFKGDCAQDLQNNDFQPILPPELRAKRTVLIFRVDDHIFSRDEEEIQENLLKENSWMQDGIANIYKFPKSNIIKICFRQTITAKKATEQGILGFNMHIPHYNIKIEEFIHINTCMKCYQMEDHFTNQCPQPRDFKVCSECGRVGHTWRECREKTKQCVNCEGPHRTLANQCPERKKIRDEKKQKKEEQKTYSGVTASSAPNQASSIPNFSLGEDLSATILTCMYQAHTMNMINPGTYNKEMNILYKINNLPKVNLPDNPPSAEILNKAQITSAKRQSNQEMSSKQEHEQKQDNIEETDEIQEQEETEVENETMPEIEKIMGTDIGLEIITMKSVGWPTRTFSREMLVAGLKKGTYKFRYTNKAYTEDQIFNFIKNDEVDPRNCWKTAEDSLFKKIRAGLIEERSPPQDDRQRSKKFSNKQWTH